MRLIVGDDRGYGYVDVTTPELSVAVKLDAQNWGGGTTLYRETHWPVALRDPQRRCSQFSASAYGRLGIRVVSEEQTSFVMIRQTRRTLTPSCADGDLSGHPPALAAGYVPNLKILIRIGT